jgi:hypothetical protein
MWMEMLRIWNLWPLHVEEEGEQSSHIMQTPLLRLRLPLLRPMIPLRLGTCTLPHHVRFLLQIGDENIYQNVEKEQTSVWVPL